MLSNMYATLTHHILSKWKIGLRHWERLPRVPKSSSAQNSAGRSGNSVSHGLDGCEAILGVSPAANRRHLTRTIRTIALRLASLSPIRLSYGKALMARLTYHNDQNLVVDFALPQLLPNTNLRIRPA